MLLSTYFDFGELLWLGDDLHLTSRVSELKSIGDEINKDLLKSVSVSIKIFEEWRLLVFEFKGCLYVFLYWKKLQGLKHRWNRLLEVEVVLVELESKFLLLSQVEQVVYEV